MKLISFDHVSPVTLNSEGTVRILDRLLGLQSSFERPNPDQKDTAIIGVDNENRPDFSSLPRIPKAPLGGVGIGSVHHIAMCVEDEAAQQRILRRMNTLNVHNSSVIDRF